MRSYFFLTALLLLGSSLSSFAAATEALPAKAPLPAATAWPAQVIKPTPATAPTYAKPSLFAVERASRFQLGVELLGPGLLYSVGGSFLLTEHVALNAAVGFFSVSARAGSEANARATATSIPLSLSILLGGPDHHLEGLGGVAPILGTGELEVRKGGVNRAAGASTLGFLGLGYRYWPADGGIHFRATGYLMSASGFLFPWLGFQFGYAF